MPRDVSIAQGLAVCAILGVCWTVGNDLTPYLFKEQSTRHWPICQTPVEVVERGVSRLGCSTDEAVKLCHELKAGDRVVLQDQQQCVVSKQKMSTALHLNYKIGLSVNHMQKADFEQLPGIGPKRAQDIVDYRTQNGPFSGPDDLLQVKGIGPKLLAQMKPYLYFARP